MQRVLVPVLYNPTNNRQIVAAVQEVERAQGTLKAIGSGWAYGGVAVDESTRHAIYTEQLKKLLRGSDVTDRSQVVPYALRDGLRSQAKHYVHVEAGIKVYELNCELDKLGLAMPTLGGSNGQSLAGAISTGTHGADVSAPPIADAVVAIHLVGPGGQEWWIERDEGAGAITDRARMLELRDRGVLCTDIRIERDTSLFRAVLVSMGRMGVVYSYVVKAVDAFGLTTKREPKPWTEVRSSLRDPTHTVWDHRWLEIFVNPYPDPSGEHGCIVTTKDIGTPPFAPDAPESSDVFDSFCRSSEIPQILTSVLLGIPLAIATAEATAAPVLAALLAVPVVGPFLHAAAQTAIIAPLTLLQQELITLLAMGPDANFAQQLANVLNQLVTIPAIGPFPGGKAVIPAIVGSLASSLRPMSENGETKESYRSYTGQRLCPARPREATNCERQMDTLEIAFDMRPGATYLFDFIADVFAESDRLYARDTPAAFGMSLRFTDKTEALLGMQRWDRTCIVEVFVLRGVGSSPGFITTLYGLAERHRGILHWGLLNELTEAQVRNHYPRLSEWRQALRRLIDEGHGRSQTFQSTFSVTRGLEPEQYMPPTVVVPQEATGETYPYDFGVLQLHERRSVTFHFLASGQHQLRVLGHDAEGDFAIDDKPAETLFGKLAVPHNLELEDVKKTATPGEEIQVKATFIAQRAGAHQGKLRIYTNAANLNAIVIPVTARVESFSLVLVQPSLPPSLNLGGVAIGEERTATFIVRNDSTRPAWLGDATYSDPAVGQQIAVQTGGIATGQTRAYALSYQPSFVGPVDTEVILHFTDGQLPPQHSQDVVLRLAAVGIGVQARLHPPSIDFGATAVGTETAPQTVEVENIGLEPLAVAYDLVGGDYRVVTPSPPTIAGGQRATVAIAFRPQGVGPRDSSYSVSSDSLYPPTPVELHGEGIAAPVLRALPDRVDFPDTVVGSGRIARIVIDNPGAVAVPIGSVSLGAGAGAGYSIRRDRCSSQALGIGQSCTIDVVFSPSTPGYDAATLQVTGPAAPLEVSLSGRASPALGLVPNLSDVDFGDVALGQSSASRSVQLTNRASTPASVSEVAVTGADAEDVRIVGTTCTGAVLQPGESCAVELQFEPSAIGTRSASLAARADVVAHEATLHGTGTGAQVAWSSNALDFGNMNIGVQTPSQSVGLHNAGNAPLLINDVEVTGDATDFVITELTPGITRLTPGGDLGFRIRFKPTATGARQAELRVHSDSLASPHALLLIGVGQTRP